MECRIPMYRNSDMIGIWDGIGEWWHNGDYLNRDWLVTYKDGRFHGVHVYLPNLAGWGDE